MLAITNAIEFLCKQANTESQFLPSDMPTQYKLVIPVSTQPDLA